MSNNVLLPLINEEKSLDVVLYAATKLNQDQEEDSVLATDLENSLSEADQAGVFTTAVGMGQILGVYNNNIFAEIVIEETGKRFIQFVQRLRSGAFTEKCRIPQELIITAIRLDFDVKNATDKIDREELHSLKKLMNTEYYGKTEPSELLKYESLIRILASQSKFLPITDLRITQLSPREFYIKLRELISTEMPWLEDCAKKEFYIMLEEQVEQLADLMGMNSNTLLKKLVEFKFLHLPNSSEGLKAKVRTQYNERRYICLKKLENYHPRATDNVPVIGNVPAVLTANSLEF